ncbi:hypothetical protein PNEG_03267 [Pneumocystis murina B123]|uniref:Metal homeostatis protein BSD2 n=1 Tax=Pneumocystis murina (strain B123) TaxID=1069680 RepID=M7P3L3_PNEMU|nr:hypothetical protein PNEG_03267 [Pneumocystis murina B123]EMR08435.1 hypothetical protein PNEG_03267 [Pneumocystis murina B123]
MIKKYYEDKDKHHDEITETLYESSEDIMKSIFPFTDTDGHENLGESSSTHLLHKNNNKKEESSLEFENKEENEGMQVKDKNKTRKPYRSSFALRFLPRYTPKLNQNDGVFANLNAKPDISKQMKEEFPPSYEQAAADATPSYWENTMIAPGISADEVFIDGLPVGNIFGFLWNMLISFSFQFIGFLLTYLLHTTHAAKNGSKAGLGTTLIQYGFYMRSIKDNIFDQDNSDANSENDNQAYQNDSLDHIIVSYLLMITGWFLLIRSTTDFLKARRIEMCVKETSSSSDTPQASQTETPEVVV